MVFAGWKTREPPLSFSIRCLKSNCGLRKWTWTITSRPARRVSRNPSPTFRKRVSSTLAQKDIWSTFAKRRQRSRIPVIASLNSSTLGGWTKFAGEIERAGADAIECNIYYIPTDPKLTAEDIEKTYLDIVRAVKGTVTIPVAVKLSPFFSNFANMAHRLDDAGADALVLFNRFYQPDIDLEELEIRPNVLLSTPQALRLPLTWIGILYGRIRAGLAGTGGVHSAEDVVKMLMVGANVTMLCSSLMRHGVNHLRHVERELREWMEEHEYESVAQMQGSMSQVRCPDPGAFERAQYMRAVKGMQHIHMAGWR